MTEMEEKEFKIKLSIAEFKEMLKGAHDNALRVEHEAMRVYGAKDSPYDSLCYFDDFFKIYVNERIDLLQSKNTALMEIVERLKRPNENIVEFFKNCEWTTCCSGRDCACAGMPTEPEYYLQKSASEALAWVDEKMKEMK